MEKLNDVALQSTKAALQQAVSVLDELFGDGYAKSNPEQVLAVARMSSQNLAVAAFNDFAGKLHQCIFDYIHADMDESLYVDEDEDDLVSEEKDIEDEDED